MLSYKVSYLLVLKHILIKRLQFSGNMLRTKWKFVFLVKTTFKKALQFSKERKKQYFKLLKIKNRLPA